MILSDSFSEDYFSIDDILATQERVPCKFLQNVPNLGKLDSTSTNKHLEAGSNMELPLWMILSLSIGRQPIVEPNLPVVYSEMYREILKADPSSLDLHKLNLHFYELGDYLKNFDTRGSVKNVLEQTFQRRYKQILDLCEYTFVNPKSIDKLDALERRLYDEGHHSRIRLNEWLAESRAPIQSADMVVNHKKRKRVEVEDDK